MVKTRTINSYIMDLILIIYFSEQVFPLINEIVNPTIVNLLCIICWIFISGLQDRSYYARPKLKIAICMLFYITTIAYSYLWGQSVIAHRYASLALMPFAYIIYDFYSEHKQLGRLKNIICITFVLATITVVNTFRALLLNPYISRSIKSSGEYSAGLARQGIGGYSFIYFVVASGIIFLHFAFTLKQKHKKILSLVAYIFSVIFVMKSNYMTALIVLLVSSLFYFVVNGCKKGKRSILYISFISIISVVIVLNMNSILNGLRDFLPARISRVIYETGSESVFHSIVEEFLLDRWPTMQSSIEVFRKYPIFGAVGNGALTYDGSALQGLGQHSYILDTYAFFGLIIGTWSIYVIAQPYRDKNWERNSNNIALTVAMGICIFLLFLFNNATESIALVSGIIMPLVRKMNLGVSGGKYDENFSRNG